MFKKFTEFRIWFTYSSQNVWNIVDINSDAVIGYIYPNGNFEFFEEEYLREFSPFVESEWSDYKNQRPEYKVGQLVSVSGDPQVVIKTYEDLLTGILLCRAYRANIDEDIALAHADKVLNWLRSTDFYVAPASTVFHESFPHGLLWHTLSVYNNMVELSTISKFENNIFIDSAALCCLVHDWCKINLYEPFKRNVKNETTGQWEKRDSYKRGRFAHPFGHGVSSLFIATKMFKLTEEEALAIRWHMSMFNVSSNEINEYQQACEEYPLVHLLQFADQLSITSY